MPQISFSLLGRRVVHITTCTTKSVPRVYSTAAAGIGFLGVAGLCVSSYSASVQANALHVDQLRFDQEMMQAKLTEERAVRAEQRAVTAEKERAEKEGAEKASEGWFSWMGKKGEK